MNDQPPEPAPPTNILLVDDHRIVREGIAAVLERESDLQVVAEASSAEEALRLLPSLDVHVIVLDLQMPGMGGLAAIRRFKDAQAGAAIVVLTVDEDEGVLLEAVRAGAAGYVLKDVGSDILVQSVRLSRQGGTVIDSDLLAKALRGVERAPEAAGDRLSALDALTPREREVLSLLAQGFGNQDIADTLGTTRVTAKKHVHHILAKLQVSDRTQAALKAVRMGLVH